MNESEILAAIHARWAATSQLAALIPADRFFTGDVPGGTPLPYANMIVVSSDREYTTERPYVERIYLQITVRHEKSARASAIARVVDIVLNAQPLDYGTEVLQTGRNTIQEPHGLWAVTQDFEVMTNGSHE